MIGLMKRDVIISRAPFLSALFLIPFAYITSLPPIYVSVGLIIPVIVISILFLDYRANMNRFTISLPINNKLIVPSRYISLLLLWIVVVLYQYIVGQIYGSLSSLPRYIYNWKDVMTVISLGILLKALLIPIYYLFKSFVIACSISVFVYFWVLFGSFFPLTDVLGMDDYILFNDIDQGFVPLVEKYIPFQPFIVLGLVSIVLYFLSMKISTTFFLRKEH
ncbi:ABC-2 transporter permease [Ornithinibacillus salinisoli]|uniref:ABC-2 transporter permease n=1 Tax=Ornithinibacillus salinisoli TaxID=1848459 RepID=A0ABW4W0F4_9BACI